MEGNEKKPGATGRQEEHYSTLQNQVDFDDENDFYDDKNYNHVVLTLFGPISDAEHW